jgi:hypothetical protein
MSHLIERAPTGRAKCRACGRAIAAGQWRIGERVPNPFDDKGGEATYWYHVPCAAFARPDVFLDAAAASGADVEDRDRLSHEAALGVRHHRLPRARSAERAPTGRATCRSCRAPIDKGGWRIALAFYEDGRFAPAGYVHLGCASAYFETPEIIPRVRHFSPELADGDVEEIARAIGGTA